MSTKRRLSASVDSELLEAAQAAVDSGKARNISTWVNEALRMQAEHDRRMQALDAFLSAYEAEHGLITETEIEGAVRRARSRATVVRSAQPKAKPAKSRRGVA